MVKNTRFTRERKIVFGDSGVQFSLSGLDPEICGGRGRIWIPCIKARAFGGSYAKDLKIRAQ